MNPTKVSRIFDVLTNDDIKHVLRLAQEDGVQVSIRGTKHSMGGHTIAPDGYVLDMRNFNRISYNQETNLVTTGTGAQWTDLIHYLNQFGLSPRTMQSYSSFSVGGTISVNAHGITTDYSLMESIVNFVIITADGNEQICSRTENKDLFGLAVGGYGLFGVITEVISTH